MTLSTLMWVAALSPSLTVLLIFVALIAGAAAGFFIGSSRAKQDVNAQIEKAESRGVAKGIEQRKRDAEAAIGSAEKEAERIRLAVGNDCRLPDGSPEGIFDRFVRLENAEGIPGAGLGLSFVRDAVRQMSGRVSVSVRDGWFTLTVSL